MRTKNVVYGSFATGLLSLVTLLSGLIIPRQIILVYGSEINGISNAITQFISYFNLIEAGLAGSAIFALYKPFANKDDTGINGILSASKIYYEKVSFLFACSVLVFSVAFSLLGNSPLSRIETFFLVLAIGLSGVLQFSTMSKYRVLLTAAQKTYVVAYATSFSILIKVIVLYAAINLQVNIIGIKILTGLTILVRSGILYWYVRKRFPHVDYSADPKPGALQQRGDVLLMQILNSVQHAFPAVAMTITGIPYTEISVYTVYMSIIVGVRSMIQIMLNGSIYSSFGELLAKKEYQTLKRALADFENICYLVMAILFSCLLVLFIPFLQVYTIGMDDGNYLRPSLALMLSFSLFISVIRYPLSSMIQAAGHYRKTRTRTILQSLIAVTGSFVLAKPFGMYGIILGLILSDIYRTIDVFWYVPHHITHTSTFRSVYRVVLTVSSIFVSVYIANLILTSSPNSYFEWMIAAIKIGVLSVAVSIFIPFIGNYKEMRLVLKRIRTMLRKHA
ncbi:MAG: oligosaccharide flippase family protein [Sphaerochaetaceae bacterium]|nr:oligosaccharide flippase family protein [Sphaerochaetaceae bacterium]